MLWMPVAKGKYTMAQQHSVYNTLASAANNTTQHLLINYFGNDLTLFTEKLPPPPPLSRVLAQAPHAVQREAKGPLTLRFLDVWASADSITVSTAMVVYSCVHVFISVRMKSDRIHMWMNITSEFVYRIRILNRSHSFYFHCFFVPYFNIRFRHIWMSMIFFCRLTLTPYSLHWNRFHRFSPNAVINDGVPS